MDKGFEATLARLRKATYFPEGKRLPDDATTTVRVGDLRKLYESHKRLHRDAYPEG